MKIFKILLLAVFMAFISCDEDDDSGFGKTDLLGEWKITGTDCITCDPGFILFNNDGTVSASFENSEFDVTINNYALNGNNLIINHTEEWLECEGGVTVIQSISMILELTSSNTFIGTYIFKAIGGQSGNCTVQSSSYSLNVKLTIKLPLL